MPNEMIPFSFEIKITHSYFCYYGIYYSNKDGQNESLFLIYFFYYYGIRMHGVAQKFNELV